VVWEGGVNPVPLSQFTPRIDANPIWLFFPVHSQGDCSSFTVAGSGQASQRGPFLCHYETLSMRSLHAQCSLLPNVLCCPTLFVAQCSLLPAVFFTAQRSLDALSIGSFDVSNLRFHWMECPPCWYNEGLLVVVKKDELIKQMCYNNRSAGLFKPRKTHKYPCSIIEGNSHLVNYV
jgi:hypothetical protein